MRTRSQLSTALGVVFAALATLLVTPGPAFACTCALPVPPLEALEETDAVFSGEVVATWDEDWMLTARIEVDQVWKGEVPEVVDVTTHLDGAACGYWLEEGAAKLVYAHVKEDGTLTTNVCTRTMGLERAEEEDLDALGPGSPPVATSAATETGGEEPATTNATTEAGGSEAATANDRSTVWWLTVPGVLVLVFAAGVVRRGARR